MKGAMKLEDDDLDFNFNDIPPRTYCNRYE